MLNRRKAIQYKHPELKNRIDYRVWNRNEETGEENFEWYTKEIPEPSEQEMIQWEAEADVILKRKKAYPKIEDQLDKIFHGGLDGWKAEIQAIKEQYSKAT